MGTGQLSRDWDRSLAALPIELRDVYFSSAYHALHAAEGEAAGFTFERGPHRLIVPGLRIGIPSTDAYDLQTPNGYGGPLLSPDAPEDFLAEAWQAWRDCAAAAGIVVGFFRLHPLLENGRWLPEGAKIVRDRKTVYVDLSNGLESAWMSAEGHRRNTVNRGRKKGLQVCWNEPDDWREFEALYTQAMLRLNAPDRLRFNASYFAGLRALGGTELACIRDETGIVAGDVFLWGPVWGHYHLAARREDSPNYATSLLMQSCVERAFARGLRGVHLGGGASNATDDGVLVFKQSFGGMGLDFEVARVIADEGKYQQLVDEWTHRQGRAPSWLLGYRQPTS